VTSIEIPSVQLTVLAPHLVVLACALAVMLLSPWFRGRAAALGVLSAVGCGVALVVMCVMGEDTGSAFQGMVSGDPMSAWLNVVILLGALMSILVSLRHLPRRGIDRGEYYALMLFSTLGGMMVVSSNDMVALFLGIETLSIPLYVLAGMARTDERSNEAGLKYLVLGAFASAFLLYGMALVFGATGQTSFAGIAHYIRGHEGGKLLLTGVGLALVGLAFKVAAVPFHTWTPDVYEGSPTPVTAFMSVVTKTAAFGALVRFACTAVAGVGGEIAPVVWLLAAFTMTLGNFCAVTQTNLKRMLAYSSIAHAGYVLVGVAAGWEAAEPVFGYLAVYAFMNMGAFAVILAAERADRERLTLDEYRGLGIAHPLLGAAMCVFMFGLAGLPPTGGFLAKFAVFRAAVDAKLVGLVVLAVLNSLVSLFYYLRILVVMYMRPAEEPPTLQPIPKALGAVLVLCAAATMLIGLWPVWAVNWVTQALAVGP